jgi:hypothetical protein
VTVLMCFPYFINIRIDHDKISHTFIKAKKTFKTSERHILIYIFAYIFYYNVFGLEGCGFVCPDLHIGPVASRLSCFV